MVKLPKRVRLFLSSAATKPNPFQSSVTTKPKPFLSSAMMKLLLSRNILNTARMLRPFLTILKHQEACRPREVLIRYNDWIPQKLKIRTNKFCSFYILNTALFALLYFSLVFRDLKFRYGVTICMFTSSFTWQSIGYFVSSSKWNHLL